MSTVYVAGPMTGYDDFNYPAFELAGSELKQRGFTVLNPTASEAENDSGKPQEWHWYMRRAIRMVTEADAICLLPGWEESRGATLEVEVAKALQLDVRVLAAWVRFPVLPYVVCDRLLDAETNEHCEFDGYVSLSRQGLWTCPACRRTNYVPVSAA